MSRIGNKIIKLHDGVTVTVDALNNVNVSGPKGKLSFQFNPDMNIVVEDQIVKMKELW